MISELKAAQAAIADVVAEHEAMIVEALELSRRFKLARDAANSKADEVRRLKAESGYDDAIAAAVAEQRRLIAIEEPSEAEVAEEAALHEALGSLSARQAEEE